MCIMRTYLKVAELSITVNELCSLVGIQHPPYATVDEWFEQCGVAMRREAINDYEILGANNQRLPAYCDMYGDWLFIKRSCFVDDLKRYVLIKKHIAILQDECDKMKLYLRPLSSDLLNYILRYILCIDEHWTAFRWLNDITRSVQYRTTISLRYQNRIPINVTHLCGPFYTTNQELDCTLEASPYGEPTEDNDFDVYLYTNLESVDYRYIRHIEDLENLTHLKTITTTGPLNFKSDVVPDCKYICDMIILSSKYAIREV